MTFRYEPTAPWIKDSHIAHFIKSLGYKNYDELAAHAANHPEWFWENALRDIGLEFSKPSTKLLAASLPFPKWASNGELSIVYHCIDRHLVHDAKKPALIFEADEKGPSITWTFEELAIKSSEITKWLLDAGAKPGDRAALLMPMSLEMVASFFGILRAGLTVIPIFSGYGKDAIEARISSSQTKFIFTQEKITRRGKEVSLKETLEGLKESCPSLQQIFSISRQSFLNSFNQKIIPSVSRPAESEAMLLYTSGTTGKPKACVHTPFGILAITGKEHRYAFDVKKGDRFFWFTDIGWMMGPWELFGALQFGATVLLYEGVPDYPDTNRLWEILSDHKITHFGISPTAIRVLRKASTDILDKETFHHLRILGSTGEPWDEESWLWFFKHVGKNRCPIINISGGTEIMGCLLSPTPLHPLKPASLSGPALGINVQSWSEDAKAIQKGIGHLVCLSPMPSMTKGFLDDQERYLKTYFERFGEKVWYHGDWAEIDEDGFWFLRGRSDDTIKIAGKRVGPNEFESLAMTHPQVAEVAAIGIPHEIKGECVYLYVVLKNTSSHLEMLRKEISDIVAKGMGKALQAEKICFVSALPKTRSGKILRGLIQKVALGEAVDSSNVENPAHLEEIKNSK